MRNWITTRTGLINLEHAFEVRYDAADEKLHVWWAFPVTGVTIDAAGADVIAPVYDPARMVTYYVDEYIWNGFIATR